MRFLMILLRSAVMAVRHPRRRRAVLTPDGRRLVPAGRVIVRVITTQVGGALRDADTLVSTVAQEQYGTSRTVELALVEPFRTVSHWTGLDLPHRWLNDLKNMGTPARPLVAPPTPPPPRVGEASGGRGFRAPSLDASPPPPPPHRVPTAAAPLRVWMAGDSMMGSISEAFAESEAGVADIAVTTSVQVGTGLARPDVYDWPAAVAEEVATAKPDVVVLIFGANDDQDMMADGHRVVLGTPEWKAEYAARVKAVMDAVSSPERTLLWLEVPPTTRPRINQTDVVIDQVLTAEAATHPGVHILDIGPTLAPAGVFQEYLTGPSGQPVEVRDTDGVHLTLAGGARVVPLILAAIRQEWQIG